MKYVASHIDLIHFCYECPYCSTDFFKNGNKRKHRKRIYHRHGSCGNTENRTESRGCHCDKDPNRDIEIVINENTRRT